jgi:hypothetical protein
MFEQMAPKIVSQIQGGIQNGIDAMSSTLADMDKSLAGMEKGYDAILAMDGKAKQAQQEKLDSMVKAIYSIKLAKKDIEDTISKMTAMKDAVPGAFKTADINYLKEIDKLGGKIENEFQTTLNNGFKQVYLIVAISSLIALIILAFYRNRKEEYEGEIREK